MNGKPAAEKSITAQVADYLAGIRYETLPSGVVVALKHLLLDTLGTCLAGNTLGVGCREVVDLALTTRGSPESTILGFGHKVTASMAAFANGAMSHALNYDASGADGGHLGVTALAAPLAVAELVGVVSGKDFLCGMAAGTELTARLASAVAAGKNENPGVLKGQLLGYFGAAASAGRIMKLTPVEMHSALALALMQAAGTMQVVFDGDPPAKAIYGAFPNLGGVISALLSRQGVGAEINVFDGPAGLFQLQYGGNGDPTLLTKKLGDEFWLSKIRFKPWHPSDVIHPFIEAALKLVTSRQLDVKEIGEVRIRGGDHVRTFCEPVEERRIPRNAAAAANSAFFAVAKALANGKITLGDFTPAGLQQDAVRQITDRIMCLIEPGLGRTAIVEVTTVSEERYASEIGQTQAGSGSGMSYDQLREKFLDCAQYAACPVTKEALQRIIDLIENFEYVSDVSILAGQLTLADSQAN